MGVVKFIFFFVISSYCLSQSVSDKDGREKIVIIDTGLKITKEITPYLCSSSYDSTKTGIKDNHGHGTNIVNIIAENMNPKKNCLYIIKFWNNGELEGTFNNYMKALRHIKTLTNVTYINLSLDGPLPDNDEMDLLKHFLSKNIKINVAAGNNNLNLDETCRAFPACYKISNPNFHVVGSNTGFYSNKGKVVKYWENGSIVKAGGFTFSGTSQATAIHTRNMLEK